MDITRTPNVKSFTPNEVENEAIFSCRFCYVDIFLETHILAYIPSDNAYFVKQNASINFTPGHYTRINCANCESYLGKVVYHRNTSDNELRLTGIIPKYTFR